MMEHVAGVATFTSQIRLQPHVALWVRVCMPACYLQQAYLSASFGFKARYEAKSPMRSAAR